MQVRLFGWRPRFSKVPYVIGGIKTIYVDNYSILSRQRFLIQSLFTVIYLRIFFHVFSHPYTKTSKESWYFKDGYCPDDWPEIFHFHSDIHGALLYFLSATFLRWRMIFGFTSRVHVQKESIYVVHDFFYPISEIGYTIDYKKYSEFHWWSRTIIHLNRFCFYMLQLKNNDRFFVIMRIISLIFEYFIRFTNSKYSNLFFPSFVAVIIL